LSSWPDPPSPTDRCTDPADLCADAVADPDADDWMNNARPQVVAATLAMIAVRAVAIRDRAAWRARAARACSAARVVSDGDRSGGIP